jgi:glycosyltransferase involved in cell wall biosynthesis
MLVNIKKIHNLVYLLFFPTAFSRISHSQFVQNNINLYKKFPPLFIIISSILHYIISPIFFIKIFLINKKLIKNAVITNLITPEKIIIYHPFLDTHKGGTEKVAVFIAQFLENYYPDSEIILLMDNYLNKTKRKKININEINTYFDSNLKRCKFYYLDNKYSIFNIVEYYLSIYKFSEDADIFINCFLGNIPSGGKYAIQYLHFPYPNYFSASNLLYKNYIKSNNFFIANSEFTASWIYKYFKTNNYNVIYPPAFKYVNQNYATKKNLIIYVGRISYDKRIDVLINCFMQNYKTYFKEFEFHIIGFLQPGNEYYYNSLLKQIEGSNIEIKKDLTYNELAIEYNDASYLWHAIGYDIDKNSPYFMEHFGITIVEAMANGLIPIVYDAGNPGLIIKDNINGMKWKNSDELRNKTLKLIENENLTAKIRLDNFEISKQFTNDKFFENMEDLFNKLKANQL